MEKLNELSLENLEKVKKILNIILEDIELQGGIDALYGNKFAVEIFNRNNISRHEVETILNRIDLEERFVLVMNYDLVVEKTKEEIQDELGNFSSEEAEKEKQWYDKNFHTIISPQIFSQYIFLMINSLDKIKDFKRKIDERIKQIPTKTKNNFSKFIEEIICVKPKHDMSKFKLIVNGDYLNYLMVDKTKENGTWDLLYRIAVEKEVYDGKNYKSSLDFLNTNKNCKIYTNTGKHITKILKQENGCIVSEKDINIEAITEKAFETRYSKIKPT